MIKYTLLENAVDSITYGIEHLETAIRLKNKKHYKQSILNLFQGTELLLKEVLVQIDPIIIFDKNSLYKNCKDYTNPKLEELYNCKSIDVNAICVELKTHYPENFDNHARKIIQNIAKNRNKLQHFGIEIDPNSLKTDLIELYGKVIKPCFNLLNDNDNTQTNILGEKIEELYCLHENANREESMLRIANERFSRGICYNCANYSLFIFTDDETYSTRTYCTSCPLEISKIQLEDYHECPECWTNSLIYNENLMGGICLNYKCANIRDGGVLIEMYPCDQCNDYVVEESCQCESSK